MSVIAKLSGAVALVIATTASASADNAGNSRNVSAQRRASITIYPRRITPGPNAIRHCDSWLAQEYRVSGTVIVPRMRCFWR